MAVVCAGPKAILDLPLTLEYLETRGVPVAAIGQAELPGFYSRRSGVPAPFSVADEAEAARLIDAHLGLGLGSGILVCVPVPADAALPLEVARVAVERATADARSAGIHGPALTPWLLARIAELTDGASLRANTALIENDARVAGRLAVAISRSSRQLRLTRCGELQLPAREPSLWCREPSLWCRKPSPLTDARHTVVRQRPEVAGPST